MSDTASADAMADVVVVGASMARSTAAIAAAHAGRHVVCVEPVPLLGSVWGNLPTGLLPP